MKNNDLIIIFFVFAMKSATFARRLLLLSLILGQGSAFAGKIRPWLHRRQEITSFVFNVVWRNDGCIVHNAILVRLLYGPTFEMIFYYVLLSCILSILKLLPFAMKFWKKWAHFWSGSVDNIGHQCWSASWSLINRRFMRATWHASGT